MLSVNELGENLSSVFLSVWVEGRTDGRSADATGYIYLPRPGFDGALNVRAQDPWPRKQQTLYSPSKKEGKKMKGKHFFFPSSSSVWNWKKIAFPFGSHSHTHPIFFPSRLQ